MYVVGIGNSTKRELVYDEDGTWIGTKPPHIGEDSIVVSILLPIKS